MAEYDDASLTLVAEIARSYIEYRAAQKQAFIARLRLSVLTGELPASVLSMLDVYTTPSIPTIAPVFLTPMQVITQPDVRLAQANQSTSLTAAQVAELFPSISLGGFFGVAYTAPTGPLQIWSAGIRGAVSLLDFGRIRG